MDALQIVVLVAALASLVCWILSLITRDTSWVDRAWSIVPVVYVWIFVAGAFTADAGSARIVLMAILVTAWGARLTFNFARKGGYTGMEDYRWAILRKRMRPWQFQVFNLLFIIGYQMTLLVLITLPAWLAAQHPTALTGWDALFTIAFLGFLVGETVADQQQWNFHQRKKQAGGDLAPGFATTGLFRYSRHPNFFFEQAQWWAFYALCATAAATAGAGVLGGVHYSMGYCGHGVALASYLGNIMGQVIAGSARVPDLGSDGFRSLPFYGGIPGSYQSLADTTGFVIG